MEGAIVSKISAEHLSRAACVYVRQSSPGQLQNNPESRRRQYALAETAKALAFSEVIVIDEDLGVSGSGTRRAGFERLLALICEGRVGAVFSIEASRLARNGRDWHTLPICAVWWAASSWTKTVFMIRGIPMTVCYSE